jgi:hypothetical protein
VRLKKLINGTGDVTIGRERLELRYQAASMRMISNLRNEKPGEIFVLSLECNTNVFIHAQPPFRTLVALLTYFDITSRLGRSAAQVTFFCPRQNISDRLPPTPVAQAYLAIAAEQYQN